jgi:5-methylcytosine-specific restriction endonuclease McrA
MPRTPANADALLRAKVRKVLNNHPGRARADGQVLDYGAADLLALAGCVDAPRCSYGGSLVPPAAVTFDHRVPPCRSGRHALANLVIACVACNEVKGVLTAEEFLRLRQLIRGWQPRAGADLLNRLRPGGRRYRQRANP